MNNKFFIFTCHLLVIFLAAQWNPTHLHAGQNASAEARMDIIEREMNCIQDKLDNQEELEWTDVCYTDDFPIQRQEASQAEQTVQLAQASQDAFIYTDDAPDLEPPIRKENIWEAGIEGSAIVYEEPGLMNEKGNMYGVFLNYTHRSRQNSQINHIKEILRDPNKINVYKLDLKLSGGEIDYDSQGTGSATGWRNYMFEVRGMIGYDLNFSNQMRFTPYMGLGYRYLRDDGGGDITTTGHFSYDREANYFYAPIGVLANYTLVPGWILDVILEYDLFISGEQKSHLGDVSTSYETLTNSQKRGYGLRGSFKITKEMESVDVFIEPFVRYWDIADSDIRPVIYSGFVVDYGLEPENTSTEYGIKFGVQF
jgi:hypothetical protein